MPASFGRLSPGAGPRQPLSPVRRPALLRSQCGAATCRSSLQGKGGRLGQHAGVAYVEEATWAACVARSRVDPVRLADVLDLHGVVSGTEPSPVRVGPVFCGEDLPLLRGRRKGGMYDQALERGGEYDEVQGDAPVAGVVDHVVEHVGAERGDPGEGEVQAVAEDVAVGEAGEALGTAGEDEHVAVDHPANLGGQVHESGGLGGGLGD
ncbi:hypothetical protein PG995_014451 [Apiospora arundinis]